MKNKRAFHVSLVSVLFLSFLLVGVTVASAAPPNIEGSYSTDHANTVILIGIPPDQVGTAVSGVGISLNINQQEGNLYWGTLAVDIPTDPVTEVSANITGRITNSGKMDITIVDQATGNGIGTMIATKDGKTLRYGLMQLFGGSVTTFSLQKGPSM